MRRTVLAPFLAVLLLPALAAADPTDPTDPTGPTDAGPPGAAPVTTAPASRSPITVGARVGGYGFRHPGTVDDHGHVAWDACRMNGLGVFARRPLGRLFAEAGADLYFSESFPMQEAVDDEATDRVSGLLTAAIGADVVRTRRFTAFAQLGVGLEVTKVAMTMPNGEVHGDSRALPMGFVGLGGELHLGGRTTLGASLRTNVMGYFEGGGWGHQHGTTPAPEPTAAPTLEVSPELAAQGQFYVAYQL